MHEFRINRDTDPGANPTIWIAYPKATKADINRLFTIRGVVGV